MGNEFGRLDLSHIHVSAFSVAGLLWVCPSHPENCFSCFNRFDRLPPHGMNRACHASIFGLLRVSFVAVWISVATLVLPASTQAIFPYGVRIWQTDEGLPQNSVFALAQTRDGYLWVGTQEGLARFDGVRFTVVDEPAAPELRSGWITALLVAGDGSLWIACDGHGVLRFKDGALARFTETNGLPGQQTWCLANGRDGAVWIGSEGGLTRYLDGTLKSWTEQTGLPDVSIRGVSEDRRGQVHLATRRGLVSLSREGEIRNTYFGAGMIPNALKSVVADRLGNIWVSSNEGVTRENESGRRFYGVPEGLPDKLPTVIYEDRAGRIWVGTYNGVACLVDGEVVSTPMAEAGFGDLVYTIFEDREANLWVGGRDGLYRLRPARFTTFTTREGLTANNVMSVCEDQSGAICVGIWGGGLNRLQGRKVTAVTATNGLTHDAVLALHEARDGSLWVGMDFGGGLNRLSSGGREVLTQQEGLIGPVVRVIHEDRHGALWVGTSRGLSVRREGKFFNYAREQGLAGTNVMVIYEARDGRMWIGTDGGLSCWSEGRFRNFTERDGLANPFVHSIHEDSDQTLWIGTKGGLHRFKDGRFARYTSDEGLFSDEIYEIVEDDFGHFWMSSRKGIFRVRKSALDDLDRGNIKRVTSIVFGKADGLATVQCNGVAKPAAWKARDGRIWFPTIRGVVAVESRIETNDRPPPVLIEQVVANQRRLWQTGLTAPEAGLLTVPPGRGELEIRYTALSLQSPEKNGFKHRLEGVDSGWIDGGPERTARYYNLAPGSYRFRVIACNNDGIWNETGVTLALVFRPHYWQTWWFKLALFLALALLLTVLYQARVRRLREIENLRIQIAADLHDDVGARLTKVAMVTESVDRQMPPSDRSKPHIQNIARTTREVIQAMDEIVWTINPKNDSLDNLANYLFQYAQDYFQHSGVRCRLDVPARLPDHPLSTQQRHNLFMAVKEALNNVLKHAQATEVRVGVALADSKLTITVADDGCGFAPAGPLPTGEGLPSMRQRLERIGGRLELESRPGGGGTRIQMELKVQ